MYTGGEMCDQIDEYWKCSDGDDVLDEGLALVLVPSFFSPALDDE